MVDLFRPSSCFGLDPMVSPATLHDKLYNVCISAYAIVFLSMGSPSCFAISYRAHVVWSLDPHGIGSKYLWAFRDSPFPPLLIL
jgi:hypothetical protein